MTETPLRRCRFPIKQDIYARAITLLYGTIEQCNAVLRLECAVDHVDINVTAIGHWRCYTREGYQADYIIIRTDLPAIEEAVVVGHECLHMAFHALRHAGLRPSPKSEEAYCYYHMWVARRVLTQLAKWRK